MNAHKKPALNLVCDLLDVQLRDREGCRIGRVDGILLDVRTDRPPRVAAIEVGAVTLARRLHPRAARWLRAIAVRWLPVPLRAVRFPTNVIREIGVDIELDVDAHADPRQLRLEKWLVRHVERHLPGSGA